LKERHVENEPWGAHRRSLAHARRFAQRGQERRLDCWMLRIPRRHI